MAATVLNNITVREGRTTDAAQSGYMNATELADYLAKKGTPFREAHDLVVSLNHGQPALDALCRVLERWVRHFLGVAAVIGLEKEIDDEQWVWHVGLDAQASGVLNDLYRGQDVEPERMTRMLCLFRRRAR